MAEHSFNEISRQIVDEYLKDIVFIDEEAFGVGDDPNSFDAKMVSQCFADAGKICAIYAPVNDTDIDHCATLAHSADVLVVDWRLILHRTRSVDPNADAPDDIRGEYTLNLLHCVLEEAKDDKFKVIVIYTGEENLGAVYDNLCAELQTDVLVSHQETFSLSSKNIEIVVRAKKPFQHKPDWDKFVISYENLPNAIVEIFTDKIKGLLPNYALSAITEIRNNTPKILSVFSKDLDAAYLGHEVSIPNKEDAQKLLNTCFGTAITELLENSKIPMHDWYTYWTEAFIINPFDLKNGDKKITITAGLSNALLNAPGVSLFDRLQNLVGEQMSKGWAKKLAKESASLFGLQDAVAKESCSKFVKLTQDKNLFGNRNHPPMLTLGTVIKHASSSAYFICIQQSCDSQRIPLDNQTSGRDFLFLSLKISDQDEKDKVRILLNTFEEGVVDTSSYSINQIHFLPEQDKMPIYAKRDGTEWVFESSSDNEHNKYIWQFDIKESYALHIVNKYVSQLTRVGVDIAECMRIKSE